MKPLPQLAFAALLVTLALATTAFADIEHRQSELVIEVKTLSGVPIANAEVTVEMLNPAFRFGTAVEAGHIEPENGNFDPWTAENIEKYFNSVTFGNVMKWSYYEDRTPERMLEILGHAQSYNAFGGPDQMRVRGHATIWGASYQVPPDVRSSNDGAYIHDRIIDHIADYHTTFKDVGIDNFDLYNEHFHERALLIDKIVPSKDLAEQAAEVATWFNKAKEVDPTAILFINDYNILNFWQENDADVIAYKEFVDAVRDAGGQIDGIGLQGHMDRPTTTKAQLTRRLNILAAPMDPTANFPDGLPGLRIEITELDMNINNAASNNPSWQNATPEEQAIITENVLEAAFEHPSVDGVTIWGMNDYFHWRDNAILFDDLDEATDTRATPVLKQSGQVWIDHVLGEWWTDLSGSSDNSGRYDATVFKGTHRITVTVDGVTQELTQVLDDPQTLTFEFAFGASDADTYSAWADFQEWANESDALRGADPDGDGRDNFSEFVEATDPLVADRPRNARLYPSTHATFDLVYSVRAAHDGLIVGLEASNDLAEWQGAPVQEINSLLETIDGVSTYLVQVPAPEDAVFYRITAIEAEP